MPVTQDLGYLAETPSQTAGPYVHIGLIPQQAGFDIFDKPFGNVLVDRDTPGERIRIEGRVLDGLGAPCRDILLEVWQATTTTRPISSGTSRWIPGFVAGAAPGLNSPPASIRFKRSSLER